MSFEIWMFEHNRIPTNPATSFLRPKFNVSWTFSHGALEDRLLYRDLLASFVARAINNGFIERADSRRPRGTKEGESAKRGKTRGKVLYRHRAPSSEAPSTLLRVD